MHRTFDTSPTRRRRELDGQWAFTTAPPTALTNGDLSAFPDDADTQTVPGTWNTDPDYHEHEGPAWYRRQFELPAATTAKLTFHGVCHDAAVWLDGEQVATHYGGHTPFEIVTDLAAGEHELVVRADNTRDERSLPRPGTDWFPYGGITREVVLESVPSAFVDDIDVRYTLDGDTADVSLIVTVRNTGETVDVPVTATLDGTTHERTATVEPGTTAVEFTAELSVDRWTTDDPRLYAVRATVGGGDERDELRDRVGFRTVSITDTDILLNGDPIAIRGVNRHEDHPEWGHTQPLGLQERDLDVIEAAGMNAVRTSHYPNHPRLLDRCDERGVLVIEEIPLWQFDGERFERGGVLDRARTTLTEMIRRDRTHPSVLAWSVTNECANEEPGVQRATRTLIETARDHDDRPVTLASNRYHPDGDGEDPCLEAVDFVCANAYPGWYRDGEWANVLAGIRSDYPELPVVVSEFGAGAVAGERTHEKQKWSEGYQTDYLTDAIETFADTEYVVGWTVWQFCDTRTDPRNWKTRPKTKNNKGIVDEYRRPKEAYRVIAERLTDDT
jgi:beta-glucuronidase